MTLFLFAFTLLLTVVALSQTPKSPDLGETGLDDFSIPKAEEGASIPIIFGTVMIESPNIVWYGDLYKEDVYA